ncbi:secretion protein HylD [Terasakiispira papahanaumokuakeensis]|uniref:Membrane fusion protein (MFP) family protein n=1 Tax=Terasakiispira papahanaumokuakeensis TaxID=197479 RepID=A0A1E2VDI3_9GAMM|nr:HlyD family type I secretion periplasmic adaptor subunit [Terasakiispira papahanaumokuakeensis]ODC05024.1 secretion protein HylD [Terasakiispira papahanaumokuakeensis]
MSAQPTAGQKAPLKATSEQRGFDAIGHVSNVGQKPLRKFIDRFFSRHITAVHLDRDWSSDADWARMQQEPIRARAMLYVVFLALVLLVVWACFAPIDEVTRGTGRVIPSKQLQRIQSLDGGVVKEILVHEGQKVHQGQELVRIDPTRFLSDYRQNQAKILALQAREERFEALVSQRDFNPTAALVQAIPQIVEQERKAFLSMKNELAEAQNLLRDKLTQAQQSLIEMQAKKSAAQRELKLSSDELNLTKPLLETGAVSEVEILRLRRRVSTARGDAEQAAAAVSRLQAAVAEARGELAQIKRERQTKWRDEMSRTLGEINALRQASSGLEDRVNLSSLKSSVDGIVQSVQVNTVGGVVQPGQDVIQIVPTDDQLLVEARIAPKDIAFLRPGQPATIKLTAYDFSIYGGLQAQLENISADTVTDDEGNTFYLVKVRTTKNQSIQDKIQVIPGMTAQVDIVTGKRTIMQYLLKPILRAWGNAMGER